MRTKSRRFNARRKQELKRAKIGNIMQVSGIIILLISFILMMSIAGTSDLEQYGIVTNSNTTLEVIRTIILMAIGGALYLFPKKFWS